MKLRSTLITAVVLTAFSGSAQDAYFSNTGQSLLRLNPSFAGSNKGIRNQAVNRSEQKVSGYTTIYNTFDMYLKSSGGGIGITYLNDTYAYSTLRQQELGLSYAQWISLADDQIKIVPSLQVSYLYRQLDVMDFYVNDAVDRRYSKEVFYWPQLPTSRKSNLNFSSGLLFVYKNMYAGFSVHNLNQPDIGLLGATRMPARFNWHASYNLSISEKTIINFSGRAVKQGAYTSAQLIANAVILKHVCLGIGYGAAPPIGSYNNVLLLNAGIRTNYLTAMLGYEGDLSSDGSGNIIGAWELSLGFTMRNKENRKLLTDFETW